MAMKSIGNTFFLAFYLATWGCIGFAKDLPVWAQENSISFDGKIFKAACMGEGPSVDQARDIAISSCKASATQMLKKETVVKSMSVETEKAVSFYQEVSEEGVYRNLICKPERESISESANGVFKVWILCRIDTSIVSVATPSANQLQDDSQASKSGMRLFMPSYKVDTSKVGSTSLSSAFRYLSVSSIPSCDSIHIKGDESRITSCSGNPTIVEIRDGDTALVVRTDGYMPRTIDLKGRKWGVYESIQVIFGH